MSYRRLYLIALVPLLVYIFLPYVALAQGSLADAKTDFSLAGMQSGPPSNNGDCPSPVCQNVANDFISRDRLLSGSDGSCGNYEKCKSSEHYNTWGPHQTTKAFQPAVMPPNACDQVTWQQARLVAALDYWVDQQLNYCHHHVPGWIPPDDALTDQGYASNPIFRVTNNHNAHQDRLTCTPNRFTDGTQRDNGNQNCTQPNCLSSSDFARVKWEGVDCSDFTSWVYNFAGLSTYGQPLLTAIGAQACDPTQDIDGVLIDINHSNIGTFQSKLQPGDLLYIMQSGSPAIVHVVVWTGLTWGDIKNCKLYYQGGDFGQAGNRTGGDFCSYFGGGKCPSPIPDTTPLIVDSHFAGPAYRPFSGWYQSRISHVRRIINAAAVKDDPQLNSLVMTYQYDSSTKTYTIQSQRYSSAPLTFLNSAPTHSCSRPKGF